jgi:hypothetical protein
MNGMEDEEVDGNVGYEYERVRSESDVTDRNCEDTDAETDDSNGEHSDTGEAEGN